jgi:hypothetical protein
MPKYSGADWIEHSLKKELSPIGREVADILGQAYLGIYHLERQTYKVDWSNKHHIEIVVYGSLNSYDDDILTRLIVLCYDRMIRLQIDARAPGYFRLMFHQRNTREGDIYHRLPRLKDQINLIRDCIGLGEKEA